MGLQVCGLNLNRAGKELQPHGTYEFPCAGYSARYTDEPEDIIPWHWHEELEAAYVKEGAMRLRIPARTYELKAGDCIILNTNIPHYAAADPWCELESLVFGPMLITGNEDSVFARKYLLPLTSCPSFGGYLIKSGESDAAAGDFLRAFEAIASDCPGNEFKVRNGLSGLCFYLYQQFEKEIVTGPVQLDQDSIRIRRMLDFIHQNFAADLTLSDISGSADIGERECLRCFQRTIQLSPMQYLLKYRVTQAAGLLHRNPQNSISEISAGCGFDSPSYFAKMFKRFYLCTPKDFRKQCL